MFWFGSNKYSLSSMMTTIYNQGEIRNAKKANETKQNSSLRRLLNKLFTHKSGNTRTDRKTTHVFPAGQTQEVKTWPNLSEKQRNLKQLC